MIAERASLVGLVCATVCALAVAAATDGNLRTPASHRAEAERGVDQRGVNRYDDVRHFLRINDACKEDILCRE